MILYFISNKGMMTFSSIGNLYHDLKMYLINFDKDVLNEKMKKELFNQIEKAIENLINNRQDVNLINKKTLTTYKRKYKGYDLILDRSEKDVELLTWLNFIKFIEESDKIKIFELPSFKNEIGDLLLKLKNDSVQLSDIPPNDLEEIKKYDLVLIKENKVSLKDKFREINFFM
jgi:hypothetical protein